MRKIILWTIALVFLALLSYECTVGNTAQKIGCFAGYGFVVFPFLVYLNYLLKKREHKI
jgi:hypothetical protein